MVGLLTLCIFFLLLLSVRNLFVGISANRFFFDLCILANDHWIQGSDQLLAKEEVDHLVEAYSRFTSTSEGQKVILFQFHIWSPRNIVKFYLSQTGLDLDYYEKQLSRGDDMNPGSV